jgi:ADP-heptose:LPS heptosyltransferase
MTKEFPWLDLAAGEEVVMNDANAASVLAFEAGRCDSVAMGGRLVKPFLRSWPASVLIVRAGGFGDLIALRPTIAALVARGVRVGVATLHSYHEALTGSGASVERYPVPVNFLTQWEQVVTLENVVEVTAEAKGVALVDLWADRLGVKLKGEERQPRYAVPEFWQGWAAKKLPRNPAARGRIGVQLRASAACRTWDFETRVKPTVEMLLKKGYQVLLFDTPGRAGFEGGHPLLVPVFADKEVTTWHQTAALLETCDGYLGPDSGVTHLAGALGVPGVALFGAFSSRLRVDCYPSLKALDGTAPCAPCFHHAGATGIEWPERGPCVKTGKCVALQELVPVRVVFQLEKWMEERRGARAA